MIRRAGLVAAGVLALAFVILWTVGPKAVARELDHTLRGGHPTHRPPRHAGLGGIAIDDLVLHGEKGELARVGTLYLLPVPAWPPLLVDVDGLTVTRAGISALQGFPEVPGAWEAVQTSAGEFSFDDARGVLRFGDPMHASLQTAGNHEGKARYFEVQLEATQDSATIDLLITDRAAVTDTGGREVHLTLKAAAPGWQGFGGQGQ
jgi:hypothetical protein